jgi:hypothetical protein
MTTNTELIEYLRGFEQDHKPDGWLAIQMRDVTALLDIVEAQAKQIEGLKSANIEDVATYKEIIDGLAKQVEAQQADADMFWDNDDAERQYSSIEEFINDEICNGSLEVGCVLTMQRGKSLPNLTIKITSIDENECEGEYQIIDAARNLRSKT